MTPLIGSTVHQHSPVAKRHDAGLLNDISLAVGVDTDDFFLAASPGFAIVVGQVAPEDIAYGVLYLASDESKFSTGSELVIDGGWTSR